MMQSVSQTAFSAIVGADRIVTANRATIEGVQQGRSPKARGGAMHG